MEQNDITKLEKQALETLERVTDAADLEQWRVAYLGRKGVLPQFLRNIKELDEVQRRQMGAAANELRGKLEALYKKKNAIYGVQPQEADSTKEDVQVESVGHLHPITLALNQCRDIFASMGFTIVEGPDVELATYNFDSLNIPFDHPARAETDTFYLQDHPDLVLRTHVSSLQNRGVVEHKLTPPFKMFYYGPSYRSEKEDATHGSVFQQYEFMVVNDSVNLADLKQIVTTFYSLFFGREMEVRFRPAYFPFVEPGLEVDMRDKVTGKGQWLEMAGAGMVHPNVLRSINVDPSTHQGIALGGGLDRLIMLKHNIPDIRLLYGGDVRFLKQFS